MRALTRFAQVAAVTAIGMAVAGVAGQAGQARSAVPPKPDDRAIVHVLNRIGFGPAPGDLERVRTIGLSAYIDQQLQPERLDDSRMAARLAAFETLSKSTQEMAQQYYLPAQMARRQAQRQQSAQTPAGSDPSMTTTTPPNDAARREMMTPEQAEAVRVERQALTELMQAKLLRAAYSDRQLEEVMVDFWFNHFNVFSGKGQVRVYLNEYERDAIRPHVFGTFRALLQATAESPAMLFYLDNWQSSAPEGAPTAAPRPGNSRMNPRNPNRMPAGSGNPTRPGQLNRPRTPADLPPGPQNRRGGLNENYARELMELHTLGVEGGYTQKDVQEVARAFTGWTIANPRQGGAFRFEPRMHDDGEKIVLGKTIKAGGGKKDGEMVLDLLANHPSTATFHREQARPSLCRRRAAEGARRARGPPLPRDRRQHPRSGANHRDLARTLRSRGVPRQGQVTLRIRRQRGARHGYRPEQRHAARDGCPQPGHAPLRLPAADRLFRQGRGLGQLGGAPEPNELRRLADGLETRAGSRRSTAASSGERADPRLRATRSSPRRLRANSPTRPRRRLRRPRQRLRRSRWCSAHRNSREGRTP